MRPAIALICSLTVLAGACAGDDTEAASSSTTSDPPQTTTSATAPEPSSTTTTTAPPTTTTTAPSTTTTSTTTTTTKPPQIVAGPLPGTPWAVVGVAGWDVLNVRGGPGTTNGVVGTLDPLAEGIIVTGDAVLVPNSIWWMLETPAGGWVNAWYLAAVGLTEDRTAEIVQQHGSIPVGTSMEELTSTVLAIFDGDVTFLTVSLSEGALSGEQVIDVFYEEGGDSVRGFRLRVFGQRNSDSEPFSLYAVEHTYLCWRGAEAQGLCI